MGDTFDSPSYLIDSNIFLRVFVPENKKQSRDCTNILRAISDKRVNAFIPTIIVVEVQYVLDSYYKFDKRRVIDATKSMISLSGLDVFDDISLGVALEFFEKFNVKFVDCLLASSEKVQKGEAAIVSYDREFDKLKVKRLEPAQLLRLTK